MGALGELIESTKDTRDTAITERVRGAYGTGALGSLLGEAEASEALSVRAKQRAYAEKPQSTLAAITVDPAREMVTNLGDRAKVLDTYRKLSPEQRQEALRLAPGISQQLGDDRGGAVGRTLGAVSRGISHGVSQPIAELVGLGGTPEEIEFIRQLDAAASQEFSPARPGDPWYERGPLQAAEMAPWMATVVGGNIAGSAIAKVGGQVLARGASAGVPGAKAVFQATGAVGKLPKVIGLKGATTKATMAGAGGLAGITAAAFPAQYAQEVDQLKQLGMVDDTRLRLLAGGTAVIAGLVEGIVPNPFVGKVALTEGAVKAARQYLWEAAKKAPGEMSEEYLQGVTSGLGEHIAQHIGSQTEFDFGEGTIVKFNPAERKSIADAFQKGYEQAKEAALPMAFLLGVPGLGGAGLSAVRAQRLSRLQEIRAKGFVSAEEAKELGIQGKNRGERKANADAEIEQLSAIPSEVPPELPAGPPQNRAPSMAIRNKEGASVYGSLVNETDDMVVLELDNGEQQWFPKAEWKPNLIGRQEWETKDASQVPTNEGSPQVQGDGGQGSQVDSGSQVRVPGQDQGSAQPPSQEPATPEVQVEQPKFKFGQVLPVEEANRVVSEIRAGDERSKNKGGGRVPEGIREPLVVSTVPLSEFANTPDPDHGNYLKFLEDTTDPARVDAYAKQKIDTPAFITQARDTGQLIVGDGGHRIVAAAKRGDTEVPALVPVSVHERLHPAASSPASGSSEETTGSPTVSPDAPATPETSKGKAEGENQSSEARADAQPELPPPTKLGKKGATKTARRMEPTEEGRPADGKPVMPGDRFLTNTGRETTPYPKYSGSSNRQVINAEKKSQLWLMENAIAEAESRGDEFNARTFRSELEDARKGKLPQASKDSATIYVFGEDVPKVPKPFLKDVSSAATQEPAGEQDTGTKRGQTGEQVGNKPSKKPEVSTIVDKTAATAPVPQQPEGGGPATTEGQVPPTQAELEEDQLPPEAIRHMMQGDRLKGEMWRSPTVGGKTGSYGAFYATNEEGAGKYSRGVGVNVVVSDMVELNNPLVVETKQQAMEELGIDEESLPEPSDTQDIHHYIDRAIFEAATEEGYDGVVYKEEGYSGNPVEVHVFNPPAVGELPAFTVQGKPDATEADFDAEMEKLMAGLAEPESGLAKPPTEKRPARKPRTAKKPAKTQEEKAADDRARSAAKKEEAKRKMREAFEGTQNRPLSGFDPEIGMKVAQAAKLYIEAGVLDFRAFIRELVADFGKVWVEEKAPYFESAWRTANKLKWVDSPAGKVADVLTEVQDETVDTPAGAADQAASQVDRGDSQNATSPANADVLDGTPTSDDSPTDTVGDTGGLRSRSGGKVRPGAGEADTGGVDEQQRGSTDSGRASADDSGGGRKRGTGRDRAPQATRPNYHLTNPDSIIGGGPKAKFERNRKAIEIVRDIEETGRAPTAQELDTLAGYTGWGAFGQDLFKGSWENPRPNKGWEEQDEWLRIYLGEEDWKSAQQSIVNAHYTDPQTVTAMWDMLRRMGFDGGRVLEPSMGIGNFFSLMPRDLMDKSSLTGIELDTMTAKIAKLLHPQANIQQKGYQESQTPDNFYDVILSNVPFGNYPIADRRYKQDFSIHNYFFKRAFDQVKPGGVIAFLTSNTTMDGKTQAKLMRAQIAEQGDLVTAIRLPSGAFQAYAGTKVVADLIVIRKRKPGEEPMAGQDWINVIEMDTPAGEKIPVNEYWQKNPQNILGTMTWGHGTTSGRPGMIVQQPENLQALLDKTVQSAPEGIINTERTVTQGRERPNTTAMRQNSVLSQDGELWIVKGEQLVPLIEFAGWYRKGSKKATIEKNRQEVEGLLNVREAMRAVLDQQAASEDATDARAELNRVYDAFVDKYGPIGKSAAAKHLRKAGDPAANTLLALEAKKGTKYVKRPIFDRPTVRQRKKVDKPTIDDAFAMERNRSLDLDVERIAAAASVTTDEVIRQLESQGKIYKTGTGSYDASDVFLSGNMARKLRQLQAAQAEGIEGLEKSIDAVRERIPEAVPYSQIEAKLGATWVEASDYADFLSHLLNEPATEFQVERRIQGWKVSIPTDINNKTEAQHTHGHRGIEFNKLMNAAMNNATVKLTMPDPENPDSRIADPVATAEANAKIGELREKFTNWIWTSPERITRLSGVYNEEFNSTVTPEFDDVPLQFEGMALQRGDQPFNLRKHQESAVWRGIVSGKGIFAHEVGTGKTLTMAALAMESRRLGLASKPLLLAHNANSMAVRNEILEAYPNANILYVDNLDAKNKDATLQAIATENWDLIVVPHSMAERFQLRPETVEALLKPEMDALEAAALEAFEESEASDYAKGEMPADLDSLDDNDLKRLKEPTAKELVKERLKLRAKIDEAVQAMEKGTGIFFEDMAIDMVMVDEAHLFKKLPITTKQNIKGLNKKASQKGTMLMMLADYVRGNNSGRGVYLFTGTPITNTINEVYNVMRFVMAEEMEASGVRGWDGWFNNFATQETLTELSSGGTWENFDRLSSFVNLPELRQMVGQYMDIVFAEEMPEFIPRETREGRSEQPIGRPYKQVHNVTVGMIPSQEQHSEELKQRYTTFKNAAGRDKVRMMREPDGKFNPLVIEGEGVKLAMDPRLTGFGTKIENGQLVTDSTLVDPKDPNLKVNRMLHNAMAHYQEHPQTSQMIFMQVGHNDWTTRTVGRNQAGKPITERVRVFNLAREIKRRLMEEGVPENEIALFSTMSKEKRTETAQLMKEGKVRFAIGSTETMGTGVNAQDELIAMHHLDAPWMPGDLEQRNGRGHRQGNKWNTVHEYRYLTEGPQDGRRWQVLLTKSRFIEKFMRADGTERTIEMDDIDMSDDGAGSDMEKTFSAAAGDPRIMMRIRLEDQVGKLKRARNNHAKTITETVSRANQKLDGIEKRKSEIEKLRGEHQAWLDNRPAEGDKPSIKLRELGSSSTNWTDVKAITGLAEVNDTLKGMEERYRNTIGVEVQIGEYRGVPLFMNNGALYLGESRTKATWSMSSLQGLMANVPERIAKIERSIEKDQRFIDMAHKAVGEPFPKQKQLEAKQAKLDALLEEMEANPDISPAWLRAGAPIGTAVYHKGTEYEVAGHRKDTDILYADGDKFVALPAKELTDKEGTPIFPDLQEPEASDGEGGGIAQMQAIPTRQSRSKRFKGDAASAAIAAADIQKTAERLFDVPIRQGGFNQRAAGIYKWITRRTGPPSPEVVRTAEDHYANLAVVAHEIAHHIDETVKAVRSMPKAVKQEIKRLDYEPEKERAFEGWAEFIRRYMTEPPIDVAGTMVPNPGLDAPKTLAWFESTFLQAHPEVAKSIAEFRKYAQQFAQQSVFQRVGTLISDRQPQDLSFKERWLSKARRRVHRLKTNFIDKFHTLEWIQKEAENRGHEGIGIYDLTMAHYMSATSHATIAFEEGVRTLQTGAPIGSTTLWGLRDNLEADGEYNDAVLYSLARHTLFMNDTKPGYNTGMDVKDAEAWITEVEASGKRDRFEKFAKQLAQFNDDLIEMLVEAGALPRKDADTMLRSYDNQNYFPLHRVQDTDRSMFAGSGAGFVNLGKAVPGRSRKGSGRQIVDPVDATVTRAIRFYGRAIQARQQQVLAEALDPLMGGVGGMGGLMDRVDPRRAVTQGTIEEILKTLTDEGVIEADDANAMRIAAKILNPEGGTPGAEAIEWFAERHGIEEIDGEYDMDALEQAASDEPDAMAVISLWRPDYTPSAQKRTVVIYDKQGKPIMYEMDPDLYATATGMDELQFVPFMSVFREAARWFKTGAVSASTGFGTANLLRDYWEFQGKARHTKGLASLGKPPAMLGRYIAEKSRKLAGFKANDPLIRLYEESGGKVYSVIGHDVRSRKQYRRRRIGKSTMSKLGLSMARPGDTAESLLDGIQDLIAISDAPPRLADAEAAIKEDGFVVRDGKWFDTNSSEFVDHLPEATRIKAATAMAEATINFKRIGAKGQYIEAFMPFFNATVQSMYRQYGQIKGLKRIGRKDIDGKRAQRYLVYMSALASMGVLYWMLRRDDDDWREQDAYLRDGYWTWGANGKTYVRIPKPRDTAIVSNIVENMLDAWYRDDAREMKDVVLRDFGGRLPTGGGLVRGALETYIADYDYFRERDLTPEYMKELPKEQQFTSHTTRASKAIGQVTGRYLQTSPIQLEHLLSSASGGFYRRMADLYDASLDGRLGPEHLPFLRGLVLDRHQSRSVNDFYDKWEQSELAAKREEASSGKVSDATTGKLAVLAGHAELMTAIRNLEQTVGTRRDYAYQPYIVGLARHSLGYEELPSNPNPLTAEDVPQPIADLMKDYTGRVVMQASETLKALKEYEDEEAYQTQYNTVLRGKVKLTSLGLTLEQARKSLLDYWAVRYGSVRETKGGRPVLKESVRKRLNQLTKLYTTE